MTPIRFVGARVLMDDGLTDTDVTIAGDRIAAVGTAAGAADEWDARGLILAPALVDIHGDAFERQVMPRPNVMFPIAGAVLETDRQLAANGIATAYHALTLSWEPGLRSVAQGERMVDALAAARPRLTVDHRLQLRWETFCPEAMPLMSRVMAEGPTPSIAFNDHTSMMVLHPGVPLQSRPFDLVPDYPVTDMGSAAFAAKLKDRAGRSGVPAAEMAAMIAGLWARRAEVPAWIEAAADLGRRHGVPMLSHDDSQRETRDFYRARGARISEFPMNADVARHAREQGDWIVFGAPNAVRGGSHIGSPAVADMVEAGLCDILASDYYYPAMLAAIARLSEERRAPLAQLWAMVTANPAKASGLTDRGRIAPGQRADLVLLDWPDGAVPAVRATLSEGRIAYRSEARGRPAGG